MTKPGRLKPGKAYRHVGCKHFEGQWSIALTSKLFLPDADGWTAIFPTKAAALAAYRDRIAAEKAPAAR